MKCPKCSEALLMSERSNVEIDYCPSCRGVWLDRGELDKILEYAQHKNASTTMPDRDVKDRGYHDDHNKGRHFDEYKTIKYQKRHKKKSFLSDFFDFD